MRGGTLIMIGTFAIVVGFVSPLNILCVVSGVVCLCSGIFVLNSEYVEPKDEDKE